MWRRHYFSGTPPIVSIRTLLDIDFFHSNEPNQKFSECILNKKINYRLDMLIYDFFHIFMKKALSQKRHFWKKLFFIKKSIFAKNFLKIDIFCKKR